MTAYRGDSGLIPESPGYLRPTVRVLPKEFASSPKEFASSPKEFASSPKEFASSPKEFAPPPKEGVCMVFRGG
jgi:hypothetical protein